MASFAEFCRALAGELRKGQPALILAHGGPGSGKTTTLKRIEKLLIDWEGRAPLLLSLPELCYSPEFFVRNASARSISAQAGLGDASALNGLSAEGADVAVFFRSLVESRTSAKAGPVLLLDEIGDLSVLRSFQGHKNVVTEVLRACAQVPCLMTTSFYRRMSEESRIGNLELTASPIPRMSAGDMKEWCEERRIESGNRYLEEVLLFSRGIPAYAGALLSSGFRAKYASAAEAAESQLMEAGLLYERCRYHYEYLVQRSRGQGMVRHMLAIVAAHPEARLTDIAELLERSLGVTKDYLKWLLDVDLIEAVDKRYKLNDEVLALWIRLFRSGGQPDRPAVAKAVEDHMTRGDPGRDTPEQDDERRTTERERETRRRIEADERGVLRHRIGDETVVYEIQKREADKLTEID